MALKKLVSFGYKNGGALRTLYQINIREWGFANPHSHHFLKNLTGKAPAVAEYIEDAPGFEANWQRFLEAVLALVEKGAETVYVGCVGGKHRSVYLVERLGRELGVEVEHRDIAK